jgi:hypothetical protein
MKKFLNFLIFFFISIIFLLFNKENFVQSYSSDEIERDLDDAGFRKLVTSLSQNTYLNANRKMVFMKLVEQKGKKKRRKNNIDRIIKYVYDFLLSTGVQCDIYNWNNQHLVLVTRTDWVIEREEILTRFKGIIEDVGENIAREIHKHMTETRTDHTKPEL